MYGFLPDRVSRLFTVCSGVDIKGVFEPYLLYFYLSVHYDRKRFTHYCCQSFPTLICFGIVILWDMHCDLSGKTGSHFLSRRPTFWWMLWGNNRQNRSCFSHVYVMLHSYIIYFYNYVWLCLPVIKILLFRYNFIKDSPNRKRLNKGT